jgi:hypothetical protein
MYAFSNLLTYLFVYLINSFVRLYGSSYLGVDYNSIDIHVGWSHTTRVLSTKLPLDRVGDGSLRAAMASEGRHDAG